MGVLVGIASLVVAGRDLRNFHFYAAPNPFANHEHRPSPEHLGSLDQFVIDDGGMGSVQQVDCPLTSGATWSIRRIMALPKTHHLFFGERDGWLDKSPPGVHLHLAR